MSVDKKQSRLRRTRRTRAKIRELGVPRLCVHRTPRHIYAQLIGQDSASVVAAASNGPKKPGADGTDTAIAITDWKKSAAV